jgi:hypothetical protein
MKIPRECTNSAIYFLRGTFPSAKKNIRRSKRVRLRLHIWINRRKKQNTFQTPVSETEYKFARKSKIHMSRIIFSYQEQVLETKNICTLPKKKSLIHKTTKKDFSSPIPSTLTSLLQPNKWKEGRKEGNCIEDFLSFLVTTNPNMSFMATYFGPNIRQYGELLGTPNSHCRIELITTSS